MMHIIATLYFVLFFKTIEAQDCAPVTPAIIGSVFGTAGAILVVVLIVMCFLRIQGKKKRKLKPSVPGYDNPLVIADDAERKSNYDHVPETDETKAHNRTTSLDQNHITEDEKSDHTVHLPLDNVHQPTSTNTYEQIRTFLLDHKEAPTNGFDVSCDHDGNIVVSNVRENGPAGKKLYKGNVIDSITVFFDDITHEDALKLLSNSAAYKVAVTVYDKVKEQKLEEDPADIGPLYADIERALDEKLHASSPVTESTFSTCSLEIEQEASKRTTHDVAAAGDVKTDDPESTLENESCSSSTSSSHSDFCSEEEVTIIQPESDPLKEEENYTDPNKIEVTVDEKQKTREENLNDTFEFIDEDKNSSTSSSSTDENSFQVISDPNRVPVSPSSSSDFDKLLDADFSKETVRASPDDSMENDYENKEHDTDEDIEQSRDQVHSPEPVIISHPTPLTTPSKNRKDIVFTSGWGKVVKLLDLMKANLVQEEVAKKLEFGEVEEGDVAKDLHQYLSGSEPIAGVLIVETETKMSLYEASQSGLVRRGTAVGLLEAQAATGNIISPYTGEKMSVDEATERGLIDPQLASVLIRAERAVLGFKSKLSSKPLSLFEAMGRNLIVESHGIRLLEAQIATGGIIDPYANHRLPVEVAFDRGLFDQRLNKILEDPSDDTKGFFDPNTNENLSYLELLNRCVVDSETSLKLLPIYLEKPKKDKRKSTK